MLVLLLVPTLEAQGRRGAGRQRSPRPAKKAEPVPFSPYVLGPRSTPPGPAAKGKPGQAAPGAKAQAAPVAEADLVTGAADLTRAREEAQRLALHDHFLVCDLDGNGWLSLREAGITLALGRDEYRRMDTDQDGRLFEAELEPNKAEILARLGALPKAPAPPVPTETPLQAAGGPSADPEPRPEPAPALPRSELRDLYPSPMQLLGRYDLDHSSGLSVDEVARIFSEVALALSPELVVKQMDPDDSGQLEARELVPLCFVVSRNLPEALRAPAPEPGPAAEPDGVAPAGDADPERPRLEARTHFARLDPSGDGAIDDTDLRALQSPARLGVRVEAVLAALDTDGDGRLSQAEFRQAMGLTDRPPARDE